MPNTNGEDLLNKNLNKPLIRTMEDDLKAMKTSPAGRAPLPPVQSSKASLPKAPQNLPINPMSPPSYQSQKSFFRPPESPKPEVVPEVARPMPKPAAKPESREGYLATRIGVSAEPAQAPEVEPSQEPRQQEEEPEAPLGLGVSVRPKYIAPNPPAQKPAEFKPPMPKASEPELPVKQPFFAAPPKPKAPTPPPPPPPQAEAATYVPPGLPVEEQEAAPVPVVPPKPVVSPKPAISSKPAFKPQAPASLNPFADPKPKAAPAPRSPEPAAMREEAVPAQPVFRPRPSAFSPRPPAARPAVPASRPVKKQPFGLEAEYASLTPEMRLARQGSSFSVDLEAGMRKDAEMVAKPVRSIREKLPPVVGRPSIAKINNNEYALPTNPGSELVSSMMKEQKAAVSSAGSIIKTVLKFLVILLIIGALAFGIYYFFKIKGIPGSISTPTPAALVPGVSQFEVSASFDQDSIPEIKNYFKTNSAKTMGASEVLLKERSGGSVLKMNDFSKALKINVPPSFMNNLDGAYSLLAFNYPQDNYLRLGLVLRVKDANSAVTLAESWEPTMFNDLGALFMGAPVSYDSGKKFGDGAAYKNINIRYLPLGKNKMALNYAIDKDNKLFIVATSKEDIYYIIDQVQGSK